MFRPINAAQAARVLRLLWIAYLVLVAAAVFAMMAPAMAQTEARVLSSEVRWLTPYAVEMLILLFGTPIVAGLAGLIARGWSLLGLQQTAAHRETVEQVLGRGLDLARKRYGRGGLIPADMEHSAVRLVSEYAVDKGPQALKRFGISQIHDPRLREMIEARMGDLMDPNARVSDSL